MIGRALVLIFSIILMVCFCLQYLLISVPFIKQIEFERICHEYSMIMDKDGGLTSQKRIAFVTDLENKGYTVTELHANVNVPYEEEIFLTVQVSFMTKKLNSKLIMEELPLSLIFQSKMLSRKTVLG